MRGRGRWFVKNISLCFAAGLWLSGCGRQEAEEPLVIVEQDEQGQGVYELGVAAVGDIVQTQRVKCVYKQTEDQEVSFNLSGRIVEEVYVHEGDTVKTGDLLAQLSDGSLEQDIVRLEHSIARNELLLGYTTTNEELELSRVQVNYTYFNPEGSEAERDKEIAEIKQRYRYLREDYSDALEFDRLELEELKRELESNRVYALIDGTVYDMKEELEGSTSRMGETVMTIVDNSRCIFETNVPEYAHCFEEGVAVSMQFISGAQSHQYELLPWHMDEWGETQMFVVAGGLDGVGIEVGDSGTMTIETDRRTQVLYVPASAVHRADDGEYVYVLGQDNVREVKWIETGLYGDQDVEIISGLVEGERVIVR